MKTADDHFRDYFKAVTPTAFPPCPVPPAIPSSVNRQAWVSRAVLALAAGLLLALGLLFAPNGSSKKATSEPGLLNEATAKGVNREPEKPRDAKPE
jgi:hypothetical protein